MTTNLKGILKKILSILLIATFIFSIPATNKTVFASNLKIQPVTFSTSRETMAVILNDGSLWMWGTNEFGQLGNGTTKESKMPIKVMEKVKSISVSYYVAVIKTDGSLWTWGNNSNGQLGDGTTKDRYKPKKVLDNVVKVCTAEGYTVAIKTDGSLWTWGYTYNDVLGHTKYYGNDGIQESVTKPKKFMKNVADVSAGGTFVAALKTDGTLWTWGINWNGQLGNGIKTSNAITFKPIKVMKNVTAISAGSSYACAIKTDGSLWSWGAIGDGPDEDICNPIKIMDNVASVSAGSFHTAAVKTDGSLWVWGDNTFGELGNGTKTDVGYERPEKVMEEIVAVNSGAFSTSALKADGTLWILGKNNVNTSGNTPTKLIENVSLANATMQETSSYQENENIMVLFNNKKIAFETVPIIKDGEILVNANDIFEGMGISFKWNKTTKVITATKEDVIINLQIGYHYLSRNGEQFLLEISPQIIKGNVYVPIKKVADAFSASFNWDENNQKVSMKILDSKITKQYVKYEEKMKIFGFDKMYNNKRTNSEEPVTKAEALKMAISCVLNTGDISDYADEHDEYEDAIWVEYAKDMGITTEDINSGNYSKQASYIDVLTYFENCKINFLKKLQVKDTEINLKDISSYSKEQQTAIKDMVAHGITSLISDNLNGNDAICKGQLNEIAVNFSEKYSTITMFGDKINNDPQKVPSNSEDYPYTLSSIDNAIYEMPYMRIYGEVLPKDLYAEMKERYGYIKNRIESYFNAVLNIDYKTITTESLYEQLEEHVLINPNKDTVDYYVKYVKKNNIVIQGKAEMQEPIIYSDGAYYRVRIRLIFDIKQSKTKENLLYLNILEPSGTKTKYEKDSYNILVDYPLESAYRSNNLYVNDNIGLYKTIQNKGKSGIVYEE